MKELGQPVAVGRTAEIFAWEDGQILKLYRDWCPPNWVVQEAHVARLVSAAGVPSPAVGEIVEVQGRRGILYQRLEGRSMLDTLSKNPLRVGAFGEMLARLQLEMHRASGGDLNAQRGSFGWSIEHAPHLPEALRSAALERLAALPEGDRLCHGDFHPGNVIVTRQGPVVIDWMTAFRGHPAADVARTYLLVTLGDPPPGTPMRAMILLFRDLLVRAYLSTYRRAEPEVMRLANDFLPVIAAARMNEDIQPEREKVIRLIETSLQRPVI